MKTLLKISLGAVITVLLLTATLLLYVLFGDLSRHKDLVVTRAADATGISPCSCTT